jgi:hypothetical protein
MRKFEPINFKSIKQKASRPYAALFVLNFNCKNFMGLRGGGADRNTLALQDFLRFNRGYKRRIP